MSEARGTRYPAEWQRKAIWAAVSALAVSFLIFVLVAAVWMMAEVISFVLQILFAVAIAAIVHYLLIRVVTRVSGGDDVRTILCKQVILIDGVDVITVDDTA